MSSNNQNKETGNLMLLDDEADYRRSLARLLRYEGFTVTEASDIEEARAVLAKERIDLALVDYMLKGGHEGTELLQTPVYPMPPVVMISNKAGVSEAAKATRLGAMDFLDKEEKDVDRILSTIRSQLRLGNLLRDKAEQYPLKGTSTAMIELRELILRWAQSPAPVLILGETGTGKEAVARALHHHSPRAFKPFVVVNCPALPEGLVESELFGHTKGAFSGAHSNYEGALERARTGVLYLAEVGELSPLVQSKLLQVLSDGEARRIGSDRYYKTDLRIVAATNRKPEEALRQDFYERLAQAVIEIPPLEKRREDIPEIVHFWLERLCIEEKRFRTISADALAVLQNAVWPGNVRQLIRILRQLIVLGTSEAVISAAEVQTNLGGTSLEGRDPFDPALSYTEAQFCFDRELLRRRIAYCKNVKQDVAKSLRIGRTTFWEKRRMCGLG